MVFILSVHSRTVKKTLLNTFSREGFPDEILSDNGPPFKAAEFEEFLRDLGAKHSHSSVYYPQAYGFIERFNRVLKHFIPLAFLEKRNPQSIVLE